MTSVSMTGTILRNNINLENVNILPLPLNGQTFQLIQDKMALRTFQQNMKHSTWVAWKLSNQNNEEEKHFLFQTF